MSKGERIDPAEFVVKSKVRQLIREADMQVSADLWDELGRSVGRRVKMAISRAQANGRKTVRASDV